MDVLKSILLYVIPFLVIIGVVVTIHELGHFLAAKALGTKIDRFAIGFGRAIAQWTDKAGVEWRIGWMPIGGYVRFAGDDNAASIPDAEDLEAMRRQLIAEGRASEIGRYFHFKPLWQRAVIVSAGPIANFLLAIVVFTTLLLAFGQPYSTARIDTVVPGSPAAQAGFQVGDVILKMDGDQLSSFDDITEKVILSSDTPINFTIQRGGQEMLIVATPRRGVVLDRLGRPQSLGKIGLGHQNRPGEVQVRHYNFPQAVAGGVQRCVKTVSQTLTYVGRLFSGREKADQLAGPLGMAQLSGDLAKHAANVSPDAGTFVINGLLLIFELIGVISVGIGFMNLLPVPVLDGGHLLFYAFEAITRRPLAAKVQAAGYRVGLALVLGLMLFATWNDLQRLRVFNLFGSLFS